MNSTITVGEGVKRPQGHVLQLTPPPVEGVASALREQPQRVERWWSIHHWARAYRTADGWESSIGVAVDLDYKIDDEAPSPEAVSRISELARSGTLPGSLFHLTPHGARVVFVYETPCTHREMQVSASKGAAALVERALAAVDLFSYVIDPCSWDLARLYFTPNAIAKGVPRSAEILTLRATPYEIDALASEEPPAEPARAPRPAPPRGGEAIDQVAARWSADHPREYPRHTSLCPVCGGKASFGHLPNEPSRWHCFSTHHPDGVGLRGAQGFHGDSLDLEAYERGCKPIDVLRRDGYLCVVVRAVPPPPAAAAPEPTRPLRSNSYLTAVTIIDGNRRDVLGGRTLELNAMSGRLELGRQPLTDEDTSVIRSEIERHFAGGIDKDGNEVGLKLSHADVHAACAQVARAHSYHPVRDYLDQLSWDGTQRIDAVPEDILGATRTPLNSAMIRRFMIGACARARQPGCKVDTVLVLVGPQGCGKSAFFRALAGQWFVDTALDISTTKSLMTLRTAWIYEWAELEAMRRAKDATAIKAFLSSSADTYVPQYGRNPVDVPRSCVIVGSTNNDEFLADHTGSRRFWPLAVGAVNLTILGRQRDQLWAEASALLARGEPWWLTEDESTDLAPIHTEHETGDSWDGPVLDWAETRIMDFSTADVLADALSKPKGQWTRSDEMRVASVLKRHGWRLGKKPPGKARRWLK